MIKLLVSLVCLGACLLMGCSDVPPVPKGESPQHPLGMAGHLGKPGGAKAYSDLMKTK